MLINIQHLIFPLMMIIFLKQPPITTAAVYYYDPHIVDLAAKRSTSERHMLKSDIHDSVRGITAEKKPSAKDLLIERKAFTPSV